MLLIINKLKNADVYLLPIAIFFILISSAGTNIFILLAVLFSLVHCVYKKNYQILFEKNFLKICFLIYFLFLISSLYSISNFEEIISSLKKYIKFLYIPFIYYIVKIHKNEKLIINFFIFGSTIILVLSYLKYFNIFNFDSFYEFLKNTNIANPKDKIIINKTSVFQNYIVHGVVFSFYSFLCFYLAKKNNSLLYYSLALLSFVNVLFLNDSRTGYIIILILSVFTFFQLISSNKIRLSILLIFCSIFFTHFSDNLLNRVNALSSDLYFIDKNNYNTSLGYRYIWTKVGVDNLAKKPLFGFGAGSYEKTSVRYYKDNNVNDYDSYITNNPHNEFISISTQLGLVGLSLFFIFLYNLFKDSNYQTVPIGIVITVFVSSLFNSAFYDNMLGLFLIIIISLLYQNNFKIKN